MARTGASPKEFRKAFAYKAIALVSHLSSAEKTVATLLIDHFNLKTGRCDPGLERLALLSRTNERTVRRATHKLAGGNRNADGSFEFPVLIEKSSHGGNSYSASYTPDFDAFKAIVDETDERAKFKTQELISLGSNKQGTDDSKDAQHRESVADDKNPRKVASITGQFCHNDRANLSRDADRNVHQTHLRNHVKTHGIDSIERQNKRESSIAGKTGQETWSTGSPSRLRIAETKANDRIQQDLRSNLSDDMYQSLWANLDAQTEQAAISAETNKRGSGAKLLIDNMNNASRHSGRS